MILTLTLSPVLDKSAAIGRLVPDQKLRCSAIRVHAGGGGVNVSRAVHLLGGDTCALFPAGGAAGRKLEALLEQARVPFRSIPVSGETRESFSVTDGETNEQYRFVHPGVPLGRTELEQLLLWDTGTIEASYFVISGGLPPGLPAGYLGRAVQQAKRYGMRVVVDSSGPALEELLQAGIYLLKPSLSELSALAGRDSLTGSEAEAAARILIKQYSMQAVLVSLGAAGALMVCADAVRRIPAPPVCRKSTIGAGDSLVAGTVWMLDEGATLPEAADFGVACGSAATEGEGTDLFTRKAAWRCYSWIQAQAG